MRYPEVVSYLDSFVNYEKIPAYHYNESLNLDRVKNFLGAIGNPQDALKCIHIAGSKGKGSTCAFIAHILSRAGYRVGLYTSPHLIDFRERIRILDGKKIFRQGVFAGMISRRDLSRLVEEFRPAIDGYNRKSPFGPLTYFEVYTCLAYLYFKKRQPDLVVLETGLGGRLDATNVVRPVACAITPISYEHTDKLGTTLGKIAFEKAGIITEAGSSVISAPQPREAGVVIRRKARAAGARLYEVGKQIKFYPGPKGTLTVKGLSGKYSDLRPGLSGAHQFINAAVAIGVIEQLKDPGVKVSLSQIRSGLAHTRWPGRAEVLSRNPLIILDGAQNLASARAIKETVEKNFHYRKLILVFGISQDKDIQGVTRVFTDLADLVVLTRSANPRAVPPDKLTIFFRNKDTRVTRNVDQARKLALGLAGKQDLILVTGSLFVVGEFKR